MTTNDFKKILSTIHVGTNKQTTRNESLNFYRGFSISLLWIWLWRSGCSRSRQRRRTVSIILWKLTVATYQSKQVSLECHHDEKKWFPFMRWTDSSSCGILLITVRFHVFHNDGSQTKTLYKNSWQNLCSMCVYRTWKLIATVEQLLFLFTRPFRTKI